MFELAGTVALVTGAGQGVGAEIAQVLAGSGAVVAVNDLVAARAERTVDAIVRRGGTALPAIADVTDGSQVRRMVERLSDAVGPVGVLVNNAGVPSAGLEVRPFLEAPANQWASIVELNFVAVMSCCRAVLPSMVEMGHGRVVNIVSDAGRVGERGIAVYSGAKAGAIGFSKALAKEVGRSGVTVNCLALGAIDAGEHVAEEVLAARARRYPMGRIGRAEDVAPAVLWLVSPEAGWVTGQVVSISGGYTIV